jgi:hypothetical protein
MPKNLNDIAREIAQDDDIKSELSKAAALVIELKEKEKKWFSERDREHCVGVPQNSS